MRHHLSLLAAVATASLSVLTQTQAQLSKVDRLLQQYGFQAQAAIDPNGPFWFNGHTVNSQHVDGFTQANYTAPSWSGSARFTDFDGQPIPGPWSVWNVSDGTYPHQVAADIPHIPDLVSMAVMDEVNWESDATIRANLIQQFQNLEANPLYNNTILSTNNFIGQLQLDAAGVSSFIQQAHPDALTFDWYPFTTSNANAPDDSTILNTPFDSWYTEMRFYRDVTLDNSYQASNPNYSVAWGLYRQIYATSGDDRRQPSASEYALETNTALAFNAKVMSDFIYNDSASQLFTNANQDATTNFYNTVKTVNARTRNFGKAMVRLTALNPNPDNNWAAGIPDILMLRGQEVTGNPSSPTTPTALPNGFQPGATNAFTSWTGGANDPWISGFGQANIGNTVNKFTDASGNTKFATGDAFISWFRPIGKTKAASITDGDVYFMAVNALSSPTATPQQCLQNIHIDFSTWPLAPGETIPSIQYLDPDTGQVVTLLEDQTGLKITNATIEPPGTFLLTNTLGDGSNRTGKLRLNVYLNGGDAFLFKFNTGTTFVGVPEPASLALLALAPLAFIRRRR